MKWFLAIPVLGLMLVASACDKKHEIKKRSHNIANPSQGENKPVDEAKPAETKPEEKKDPTPTEESKPVAEKPPVEQPAAPACVKTAVTHKLPHSKAVSNSAEGAVMKAVNAALNGPGIDKHEVYGHKWIIKKAAISFDGCKLVVEGEFWEHSSAPLPGLFPEQFPNWHDRGFYEFIFENGKMTTQNIWIQKKESVSKVVAPIVAALGAYVGVPINTKTVEELIKTIESLDDKQFEAVTQKLAMRIGAEAFGRTIKNP